MYAVLFDIDGTLIQTGGAGQLAFAEAFASEFGVAELSGRVPFAGRSDRAIAFDLMRVHGVPANEENWRRFQGQYLERLPAALKQRRGVVLPGVHELLDELTAMEQPLIGLLTGNVREGARQKLAYYGLSERFAFGGYGDKSDDRCQIAATALDEAKQAAELRCALNGQSLCGVMVIGDTVHDVSCARSIGATAIAVTTGNTSKAELEQAGPDLLLDDLQYPALLLEIVKTAIQG
jgi:phosphoglycolate phosphatase-like HAD superfamily hydrolase